MTSDLLPLLAHSRDCVISAVFDVNPYPKAAFGEAVGEVSQLTGAEQPGYV